MSEYEWEPWVRAMFEPEIEFLERVGDEAYYNNEVVSYFDEDPAVVSGAMLLLILKNLRQNKQVRARQSYRGDCAFCRWSNLRSEHLGLDNECGVCPIGLAGFDCLRFSRRRRRVFTPYRKIEMVLWRPSELLPKAPRRQLIWEVLLFCRSLRGKCHE